MNINNGGLGFTQTLNNDQFKQALEQSRQKVEGFSTRAVADINKVDLSVKDLAAGMGIAFGVNEAKNFIQQMVKVRGEFQQTEIAFNTMLQSQDKSKKLMAEMVELAKNTPMQFSEVSQGAKQLLAYQVEAENLTDTLTMLGNISSGLSVPLSRLILVYGQVRAKGKLMGDDLRQFTEAGVPMIAEIAKNMGIAQSEVANMVSEGKVGFKEVEQVLKNLTSQGGLFFNMMEEQSKTIPGQIAKLQDELEQMFNQLGKDAQPMIEDVVSGASLIVENYDAIGKSLAALVATYGTYKTAVIAVSTFEAVRAKTVASEIANLNIKDKMALDRIAVLDSQAKATVLNTQAELANGKAVLSTMRIEVSALAVKKQMAITAAMEAKNSTIAAQSKLASARAELTAIQTTGTARQIAAAQKKVEVAENAVIAAQEKQSITRKAALAKAQAFNNAQTQLESQAKKVKIAQDAVITAQETAQTAAKNLNAAATTRLTVLQNIQLLGTKSLAKAQALLNSTMLANPYVLTTAAIIGLTVAMGKMALQATHAEEIQESLAEKMTAHKESAAATEAEIQTLVEAIKSENTTNEEKESLLNKLNTVTDGKIKNLSVETIKTGELDKAVKEYTETLYKQAEAEAYLEDIKELARKKAANNDRLRRIQEEGGGFWESMGTLVDANSYKNGGWKDILNPNKSFDVTLVKNIQAQNNEIEKAIANRKKLVSEKVVVDKKLDESNNGGNSGGGNGSRSTPKPTRPVPKEEDPVEIFKKDLSLYKEQYDRMAKFLDTSDAGLRTQGMALSVVLKSKGETYLEFLQSQANQLRESAKSSEIAHKQLTAVNDEIYQLLNQSVVNDFKKQIENDLSSTSTLLEKIQIIQKAKDELTGKSDQNSTDKLKFINEKDLENQFDIKKFVTDLDKQFEENYNNLEQLRKEHDAEMVLLQDQYNKASNDSERRRISDLMNIRNAEHFEKTNGKTGNLEVDRIIEENKTLAQKRADIESKAQDDIAKIRSQINSDTSAEQLKIFTDVIAEIEQKQKEALEGIDSEILKKSEGWTQVFGEYANKSSKEILKIMNEIRRVLNDPNSGLSPTELQSYQDQLEKLKGFLAKEDPFAYLYDSFTNFQDLFKDGKFSFDDFRSKIEQLKVSIDGVYEIAEGLGIEVSDSTKDAIQLGTELFEAGSNIAEGIATKNPLQIVKGVVQGITSIINAGDKKKERQIQQYKKAVDELNKSFQQLEYSASKALGGDSYKSQKQMMENLIKQQGEYQKMINAERGKKKSDKNKIAEWEQSLIDSKQRIQDIMESIVQDVLQTNAKDLASTLGDALVNAFAQGEDAAKSFEKVVNDVLKNAVLNQLKNEFLDKQLKGALDDLYKDMGGNEDGSFNWNGLSPEEQEKFKKRVQAISENFSGMLEGYSDLFKDIEVDPNESSLSGAIKGMSEETASILSGQLNAIRILQVEALSIHKNSNTLLIRQLDSLHKIDYNTRFIEQIYNYLKNNIDNNRAYGY